MKIKICGLTNLEDVLLASELGADFLGFIFYDKSPRNNKLNNVSHILNSYQGQADPVAVFVNESYEKIVHVCSEANIKIIQLHGTEDHVLISKLQDKGFEIFKALSVKDKFSFDYDIKLKPDRFLLDTWHPELKGGVGVNFDWSLLEEKKEFVSKSIIAGGINSETVGLLLEKLKPWGIDVSSGIEAFPGKKDHQKMVELFTIIEKRKFRHDSKAGN